MGICHLPIQLGELIDQRALPGSGSAGQADHVGLARMREQSLEEIGPSGRTVFDSGDSAGESARVAGTERVNPSLDAVVQAVSLKHEGKQRT